MKQIRVLIVEDSKSDEELLLLKLTRAGYQVQSERVESAEHLKTALTQKNWDVILSDYEMPSFNGLEAHRILRESGFDIPFIIVSGSIGEDIAVQAMLAGVNDYLMKDNLARLIPAIERELQSAKVRQKQRATQNALNRSAKRYRNLFEEAGDAIYTIDLTGKFTSINKKGAALIGKTQDKILQSNFDDYLYLEDVNKIRKQREQKTKGLISEMRYEVRLKTESDDKKIVEINSRLIYKDDKPFEIEGIARDITERKKLENDLRESEKRLNLALSAAKMGVWEWNIEINDIYWSPECYSIIGVADFDGTFEHFQKILYPEDGERLMQIVGEAIEARKIYNAEFRSINDLGEIVWLSNHGIAEYDEDGNPLRLIGTVRNVTKRKNLEQNLIATETRFRTLSENNVAGVTLCEASGNLIFVNDAYLEIVGYSREDFKNGTLKWNEITAPEFNEVDLTSIEKARQNGKSKQYEKEYIRKDGSRVPVLVVIALSKIDGEEYFISTILDFTERKKIEKELHESVKDFRALVEASSQIVWSITGGAGNNEFSDFWENLTGQNHEDSKNLGWLDVIHPEDRGIAESAWIYSFTNNLPFETVYRVLTVGGEYKYFAVRGVPVLDGNDSLRKWIGTFNDITERKEVEEELRRSEARLRLSQQSARIGTWEWNIETNECVWSVGIWTQFALEPGAIGTNYDNYMKFVHPEDLESLEDDLKTAVEGGKELDTEYRIKNVEGQTLWIAAKGSVVRNEEGEVKRMIGVTIDVTARKIAEESLKATEEKLRQAQKLESIGRLAGGIAHDFNNMLTAINGYSDLTLRRMSEDDPLRSFIEEIKKSGERSASLTHQLLAFSRRQILQSKVLNINQIISDTTGLLQRLIGEDVRLVEKLGSDIGQVEADPGQITQVIMNLAVNARDAMPKGGILKIETESVYLDGKYIKENPWVKEGHYVLLKVSDTGIGIDKETLDNIFEPFFTTKEVGTGTGLGLATVYGIIKQSGGYINVHSSVNIGTTFEIFLPGINEQILPVEKIDQSKTLLIGNEKILVVEDEEVVRKLTCEILESYGYKIIAAENGREALQICGEKNYKFDLLLTDVVMPKMGGHELAEQLSKKYPQLRILFTSGYTEDAKIQYEMNESPAEFIHKPFTPNALASKVREILDM